MDRFIAKVADITIEDDLGLGVPVSTMSQERFLKRLRSVCLQQQGADTYALGKYFSGLLDQVSAGGAFIRSDGEHHEALVAAAKRPQGLFSGLEICQIGPFQRAIIEAGTDLPKGEGVVACLPS